jgi:hypothetical protein
MFVVHPYFKSTSPSAQPIKQTLLPIPIVYRPQSSPFSSFHLARYASPLNAPFGSLSNRPFTGSTFIVTNGVSYTDVSILPQQFTVPMQLPLLPTLKSCKFFGATYVLTLFQSMIYPPCFVCVPVEPVPVPL